MKANFLKIISPIFILVLLMTIGSPVETFAQSKNNHNKRDKKEKVQTKQVKNKQVQTKQKVYTPAKKYKKLPRRGAQVNVVPKRAVVVRHSRIDYRVSDGIFYRPVGSSYVVTAPPIGIRVSVLPPNPYRIVLSGHPYFYYYGTYYAPLNDGYYEVVTPPVGARIDALPDGYEVFELDNRVYYRLDDTYYKAVVENNGAVAYEVVRI